MNGGFLTKKTIGGYIEIKNSMGFKGALLLIIITALISAGGVYIGFVSHYQFELKQAQSRIDELEKEIDFAKDPLLNTATNEEQEATQTVKLYYYNEKEDEKDDDGEALCDEKAVLAVDRQIEKTDSVIEDTLSLFLQGDLTAEEKDSGYTTTLPAKGFSLKNVELKDGIINLTFEDTDDFVSGKECATKLLETQIKKTAGQFEDVKKVIIKPSNLFTS